VARVLLLLPLRVLLELEEEGGEGRQAEEEKEGAEGNAEQTSFANKIWNTWNCGNS